jgi:hypothetical protein
MTRALGRIRILLKHFRDQLSQAEFYQKLTSRIVRRQLVKLYCLHLSELPYYPHEDLDLDIPSVAQACQDEDRSPPSSQDCTWSPEIAYHG